MKNEYQSLVSPVVLSGGRPRVIQKPAMKAEYTNSPATASPSASLLLDLNAALPPSIQGTISSYRCPRKNGPPAVYHNFQYTLKGKNHSMTIPVGMVDDYKAAVASGKKLKDLVLELSATDAKALAEQHFPV